MTFALTRTMSHLMREARQPPFGLTWLGGHLWSFGTFSSHLCQSNHWWVYWILRQAFAVWPQPREFSKPINDWQLLEVNSIYQTHWCHYFEIVPSTIQDKVLYVAGDNFLGALDLLPGPLRPGGILLASRPPKQYFRRWQRLQMRNSSSSKLSPAPYRTKSCMLLGTIS